MGLRLLKQRDEVWKADVRDRIKQGMDSIRADPTIPAEQLQAEMTAFKKKWKKNHNLKGRATELSPEATDDLREIWVCFANDNPAAADKLEEHIYAACELLAQNPRLGHTDGSDLTDEPVRFWPVRGQYIVIYLPGIEPLKMVRILQGARNASVQL